MKLEDTLISNEYFAAGEVDQLLATECSQYYDDPVGWVKWAFDWDHEELHGFLGADEWQHDLLTIWGEMIKANNFDGVTPVQPVRVAIASGHGIGKSALSSWIILVHHVNTTTS